MSCVLEGRQLVRRYRQGTYEVTAVDGVNIKVEKGDFISILGPSGSGKTTLLRLLGGLDRPTSGEVMFNGEKTDIENDRQISRLRRRSIGFIHQDYQLIPSLTARENIMLPLLLDGRKCEQSALTGLAEELGIAESLGAYADELSGGQKQRVAIARALIIEPAVILADEPTGNLDGKTASGVMDIFLRLHSSGHTILMVTHNSSFASKATRLLKMNDGKTEETC